MDYGGVQGKFISFPYRGPLKQINNYSQLCFIYISQLLAYENNYKFQIHVQFSIHARNEMLLLMLTIKG